MPSISNRILPNPLEVLGDASVHARVARLSTAIAKGH